MNDPIVLTSKNYIAGFFVGAIVATFVVKTFWK